MTPAQHEFRSAGLALLEASHVYESPLVRYGAGPATLVLVGLVARGRRLLRAAYRLADAGDSLEAMTLIRALLEYHLTLRWIRLDPELHVLQWQIDDLKRRLTVDREVSQHTGINVMTDDIRRNYEELLAEFRERLGDRPEKMPAAEARAKATGDELAYSLAYRFDSQTAVHPSAWALEQLFEDRRDDGGIAVMPEPPADRGYADPYAVGAFLLLDMLRGASEVVPELELGGPFDEVHARLTELRESRSALED